MKTENDIRKEYPHLPKAQIQKIIEFHSMNGFMDDDKMNQAKAFNSMLKFYMYDDKPIHLKTLCETLAKQNIRIEELNVILENGNYYELTITAIKYIKHMQFENRIKEYYIQKQSEKTETIYFDINKWAREYDKTR